MKVEILRDEAAFDMLREEWTGLLMRCSTRNVFQTWEWCRSWWHIFGAKGGLYLVTARDNCGRLTALAPLCVERTTYYGLPVRRLTFIGHGHSDRQEFVLEERTGQDLREMFIVMRDDHLSWDLAEFDQLPSDQLKHVATSTIGVRAACEESSRCPYVPFKSNWESFLKSRSRKFRADMRNKYNNLDRGGPWQMLVDDLANGGSDIPAIMRSVETESHKIAGQRFLTAENLQFLGRFFELAGPQGWIDFSCLRLRDEIVAHLLGFRFNGVYAAYNTAYRSAYHKFSPGKVLLNEKLRWCMEHQESIREFDFLRGSTYIKSLWTDDERQHTRMVLFRDSPVLLGMRFLVFKLRPFLKRHIHGNSSYERRAENER